MKKYDFRKAVPVWAEGRENEMNLWLKFSAETEKSKSCVLCLTGSSAYNVYVNGVFFAFGPARCAHGFYRVDELDISGVLKDGKNKIEVTVAGYNVNSFYHIDQPSFICAELICDGAVTAYTGGEGFICNEVLSHEEKAERYSYQRTFSEIYNTDVPDGAPIATVQTEEKCFIERGVPYTEYERINAEKIAYRAGFCIGDHKDDLRYPRQITGVDNDMYKGYLLSEVTTDFQLYTRNIEMDALIPCDENVTGSVIKKGSFAVFKMKHNTTGKFSLSVSTEKNAEVLIIFDEVLRDGDKVDFRRMSCNNSVLWRVPAGKTELETFEPYTCTYIAVCAINADITVNCLKMIYFGADKPDVKLKSDDEKLISVFDAAIETYRQNNFTLYLDCPSRERAGWLCDSFFTSRVEKVLTGKSETERNFLENYLLPRSFRALPDGMLPMCYPGDQYNGNFIPNWAMWYVIELEEYLERTNDAEFVMSAREKVYKLLKYFEGFENESGLLEGLKGWVFVEWSKSNELTQDVNYPTNMLYAKMLSAVASLYNDESAALKAEKIQNTVNSQSWTKEGFYCDNAVRAADGSLTLSGECTETCQYYAFFCKTATPESRPVLWKRLLSDFGPERANTGKWEKIYPSNAFIGFYLRLELLYIYGEHDKLVCNIKDYFYKMACATGTLWENDTPHASCNHGFASHILYWLDKLGMICKN